VLLLKRLAGLPQLLKHQEWVWPVLIQRAETTGCKRSLLLPPALVRDLFGWVISAKPAQRLRPCLAQRMLFSTGAISLAVPRRWWREPHALSSLRWRARWTLDQMLLLSH
jgi:hypothetical protein